MTENSDLQRVVAHSEQLRDAKWEQKFFEALVAGQVRLESTAPKTGADGWPYLFVQTGAGATEPTADVLAWLSEQGVGLVVNAHKDAPDYVFTYGMIWNFRETRQFLSPHDHIKNGSVEFKPGQKIWTLVPDQKVLPDYVRSVLLDFFAEQKIGDPRLIMVSTDQHHYDFCLSLESLGNPPAAEHQGIAEAISWFLPAHYSLLLMSEQMIPNFQTLRFPTT